MEIILNKFGFFKNLDIIIENEIGSINIIQLAPSNINKIESIVFIISQVATPVNTTKIFKKGELIKPPLSRWFYYT